MKNSDFKLNFSLDMFKMYNLLLNY